MQFAWNHTKDQQLQAQRGFGFSDLVEAIEEGGLLDEAAHPSGKYPHQRVLYVCFNEYAISVPYVVDDKQQYFLKTAFPDRKATKKYLNF